MIGRQMNKRPVAPAYIKIMRKEEPGVSERKKLMSRYRKGGLELDPETSRKLGETSNNWGTSLDTRSRKFIEWIYVGDNWWAKKRSGRYEFGKMVAAENDLKAKNPRIVALWDQAKYGEDDHPVIVHNSGRKGYVVGYNKFEMLIQWEDEFGNRDIPEAFSRVDELRFEYSQDHKFFSKLFKRRVRHVNGKES